VAALCESGKTVFVGGEKMADSELGIYRASGGPQNSPLGLARRFEQLSATIAAADRMFSWRAPQP